MKYIIKYATVFIVVFISTIYTYAQKNIKPTDAGYEEYEVQFIRDGHEGTSLFKIYSYGSNEDNAIENAKRNALRAVMFTGIPGSDLPKPLITETGAEEKYKDYFNVLLQKGGKYLNYVALSNDGSIASGDRYKVGKRVKIGVAVVVQKALLRKELENAGIIRSLGSGF